MRTRIMPPSPFGWPVAVGFATEPAGGGSKVIVGDSEVKVSIVKRRDGSSPPELTDEIMTPVRETAKKMWPGVPIAPLMTAGATDGRFLMNAGIPTYGMSGMFSTAGETNAHGLNEKIRVKSLYEGRDFLETVIRAYVK